MTTDSWQAMLGAKPVHGDVAALHGREVGRLVAYLCSTDRGAGVREAEDVSAEAFLEVASTWPNTGGFSSPEVYLFACAQRIAVARSQGGRPGWGDALSASAPTFWDRADVARLTILQDGLDHLPAMPRHAVLLREMCGFSPAESGQIIGLGESAVESARAEALRALIRAIESGTFGAPARPGPLSPDDFTALSRVLQHGYQERMTARQQLGDQTGGQAAVPPSASWSPASGPLPAQSPAWPPASPPMGSAAEQNVTSWLAPESGRPVSDPTERPGSASWSAPSGWSGSGDWAGSSSSRYGWPPQTALDMPLSAVDMSANVGTPIFDAVSAWFASGPSAGASWEALDDSGWQAANARAAAMPEVAGLSGAGLPQRPRGANLVPSATDVGLGQREMFGDPRVDPGQVRHRLDRLQQGVNNARRQREDRPLPTGVESFGGIEIFGGVAPSVGTEKSAPPTAGTSELPAVADRPRTAAPGPHRPADRPAAAPVGGEAGGPAGSLPTRRSLSPTRATGSAVDTGPQLIEDVGYATFYREYLPHLMASLMVEGARPAEAAEVAQDVLSEAQRIWDELDAPQIWARNRALALLGERRTG